MQGTKLLSHGLSIVSLVEAIAQLSHDHISIKSLTLIECSNPRFNLLASFTKPLLVFLLLLEQD
jgi:hypothetical protein